MGAVFAPVSMDGGKIQRLAMFLLLGVVNTNYMEKIIAKIKNWMEECKEEYRSALEREDEYDVEYWDGKVQAFDEVIRLLERNG